MIGSELAHYRILAKLGSGGMGEVYLAEDLKLDRKVALKVLAALNHPNIITVFSVEEAEPRATDAAPGAGTRGPTHFITMEYVEGRTLAELIPADGMEIRTLTRLALPVAHALASAHASGIVHRDLKPHNVIVAYDGRVKVLDFGLAKPTDRLTTEAREQKTAELADALTASGIVVGTAPYMSPEQIRGAAVDHRSDVFSLGVVLYEMATGRRPFRGNSAAEVASAVLRDEPESPATVRPGLADSLDATIRRCLQKDPTLRFQSMPELSDALQAAADPSGATHTIEATKGRLLPRRRGQRAAAAALAALIPAAGAWYLGSTRPPQPATAPIDSIAVLPFANLSEDAAQEYFVQGIQEALINDLSKIASLRVTSRTSTLRYKDTTDAAPEIATRLGVDALVEGSVLRVGEEVRITAQVIRGVTDEHLWVGSYDRELGDVLVLLSEVARRIAREVEVVVTPRADALLARATRVDPAAHEALLRGQHAFNTFNRSDVERAPSPSLRRR